MKDGYVFKFNRNVVVLNIIVLTACCILFTWFILAYVFKLIPADGGISVGYKILLPITLVYALRYLYLLILRIRHKGPALIIDGKGIVSIPFNKNKKLLWSEIDKINFMDWGKYALRGRGYCYVSLCSKSGNCIKIEYPYINYDDWKDAYYLTQKILPKHLKEELPDLS